MTEPDWVKHAIWWQVYPLGFTGAEKTATEEPAAAHRLLDLLPWLDYVVELGASGLALGPIFAAETHGYDTTDYFRIDPRLGTEEDFDRLVAEAHRRGVRILLDGVFNHVGRSFGPFRQVLAEGPDAGAAAWFDLTWPAEAGPGTGTGTGTGTEPGYRDFEGHHHLVALNHAEPAVADFVAEVMEFWLARGADGWRLDAAYAVPAAFWRTVTDRVRRRYPNAYFVGEFIHGDYAAEVQAGGLDSATQYELWKAVWSSLNDVNFWELTAALERHNSFLDTFVPWTFIGNHDVTRIASKLEDPALVAHALLILMTVGGTPAVYYGDEQGYRGVKEDRAGGDDDIRPRFPAGPEEFSALGAPVLELHRQLIGLRRRHPWLHTARTDVLERSNEVLAYRVSAPGGAGTVGNAADDGGAALVVVLNLSNAPATVPAGSSRDVLAGAAGLDPERRTAQLPARGWAVLG